LIRVIDRHGLIDGRDAEDGDAGGGQAGHGLFKVGPSVAEV
jgi:hypothetical protein